MPYHDVRGQLVILFPDKWSVSYFVKARCLAVLDRVHTDGETVLITRRGKPLAKVVPATGTGAGRRALGTLAGEACSKGDIVHAGFEGDWESLK